MVGPKRDAEGHEYNLHDVQQQGCEDGHILIKILQKIKCRTGPYFEINFEKDALRAIAYPCLAYPSISVSGQISGKTTAGGAQLEWANSPLALPLGAWTMEHALSN